MACTVSRRACAPFPFTSSRRLPMMAFTMSRRACAPFTFTILVMFLFIKLINDAGFGTQKSKLGKLITATATDHWKWKSA